MPKNRHVYVIRRADGAHKVGFSNDPEVRSKALQSTMKQKTHLMFSVERPLDATRVEKLAHGILRPFRIGGEWFRVDVAAAVQAIMDACGESGIIDRKIEEWRQREEESQPIVPHLEWTKAAIVEFNEWAESHPEEFDDFARRWPLNVLAA